MTEYLGIPGIDYPIDGLDFFDRMQQAGMMNKTMSIIAYLYRHAEPEDGMIFTTYNKIQKEVGVSSPTVARVMTKMQEGGYLKKIQNGVWQLKVEKPKDDEPFTFVRIEA